MGDISVDFDSLLDDGDDSLFLFPTDAPAPTPTARVLGRKPIAGAAGPPPSTQGRGTGASTILREPNVLLKRRVGEGEPIKKRARIVDSPGAVKATIAQGRTSVSTSATRPNTSSAAPVEGVVLRGAGGVFDGKQKQWADPNPFANPSRSMGRAGVNDDEDDDDDDDMPVIEVRGDGGYAVAKPVVVVDSGQAHGTDIMNLSALERWGQTTSLPPGVIASDRPKTAAPSRQGPVKRVEPGSTSHVAMTANELAELEQLRREKDELQRTLRLKQAEIEQAKSTLTARQGEIGVVRGRLQRAESAHAASVVEEKRLKAALTEKLEAKEKEHRAMLERLRVEQAFTRQEQETSRRMGSSQRPGASQRRGSMPPPPLPFANSPSLHRTRGGPTAPRPAPTPRKQFGGFHNSFDGSPGLGVPLSTDKSLRIGQVGRFPMMSSPQRGRGDKGKGRMMVEDEEDSLVVDGEDSRFESLYNEDDTEGDENGLGLADDGVLNANEGRDWRCEIMSALFTHMMYIHFDSESAIAPPASTSTAPQRPWTSTYSAREPTAASYTSTARTNSRTSFALNEPTPSPTSPAPTLHAIINIRFPPATPSTLTMAYEEACRDLFAHLGRRTDTVEEGSEFDALHLARGIGNAFEALIETLDQAGLVGPLINLLSLIGHLALLFPHFASHFLNDSRIGWSSADSFGPSALLSHLGQIVRRYGRPVAAPRSGSDAALAKGRGNARSKRVRGVVMRATNAGALAKNGAYPTEHVELDPVKRNALLFAVAELLEALAWRAVESSEEAFVDLLTSPDVINIMLDPKHPPSLLLTTTRFVALLACRPLLFRKILDVKFADAPDTRTSKVPILDRLGTLLSLGGVRDPLQPIFKLHMIVLALVSTLVTRHDDVLVMLTTSPSLIPELLDKLFKDTRTLWDHDGSDLSDSTRAKLKRVSLRLSTTVHLFHYITCAPSSMLKIGEWFIESSYSGLHDRFNVAFGTLAFAGVPDWAESTEEGDELVRLSFLAQEIMEDVSPQEVDEMEQCFAIPGEEGVGDDDDGNGAGGSSEAPNGSMHYEEEGDEDEEMVIRDLSQQGA